MSELHAAAGIVNLAHYNEQCAARVSLYKRYEAELSGVPGLSFVSLKSQANPNYNYCPVRIKNKRDAIFDALVANGIFTRKYFYPLLTDMPAFAEYKQDFAVAGQVEKEILCLPIYPDLTIEEQDKVISTIRDFKG
jgi:dTDP-4-amino-4,6-dideoxygalactose transaminase